MSIQNNLKHAEGVINRYRIHLGLRILWPDFEIYDLFASEMTFSEVISQSSFPPFVINIDLTQTELPLPLISKEYTHIAIIKKKEINKNMEVFDSMYAFLTKRNMAIDQLVCKYVNEKYRIEVHVAQFDRKNYFWGVEILSNSLVVVNPRYIAKKNAMWILEYEFEHSVCSLIVYSVQRQPNYGKKYYGNYLPKDVCREFCIKFRTFQSIVDIYFKIDSQSLLNSFSHSSPLINLKGLFQNQQKQIKIRENEEENNEDLVPMKCLLEQKKNNKTNIIIKILELTQATYQSKIQLEIKSQPKVLLYQIFKKNHLNEIKQNILQKTNQSDLTEKLNLLQSCGDFDNMDHDQKISLLEKSISLNFSQLQNFIFSQLILQYESQEEKSIQSWILYYQLTDRLQNKELREEGQLFLENMLKFKGSNLLKSSQPYLSNLMNMFGSKMIFFIEEILLENQDKGQVISDILLILMKIQGKNNIYQLYDLYKKEDRGCFVSESISHWLDLQRLPKNDEMTLKYTFERQCSVKTIQYFSKTQEARETLKNFQYQDNYQGTMMIQVESFVQNQIISSKKLKIGNSFFQVYFLLQKGVLFCFVEETKQKNVHSSLLSSFSLWIDLNINDKKYEELISWNFTLPSHAVGTRFKLELEFITSLKASISFKKNILVQSILNFMRTRSIQMFKIPSKDGNEEINKLSKRRSTIMLQNFEDEQQQKQIEEDWFLHAHKEQISENKSIYNLSMLDMYSLLVSIPFKKEIYCAMIIFKLCSILSEGCLNYPFLLSSLRLEYLSLKDLLILFNRYDKDTFVQMMMKMTIKDKTEILGKGTLSESIFHYLFSGKGRSLQTTLKYKEEDYASEYLTFTSSKYK